MIMKHLTEEEKLMSALLQLDNIVQLTDGNDWQDYIYNKLITLKCELERQYTNLTGHKYDEHMYDYWVMNMETKEMEYSDGRE
jgi:hypothetical protein